MTLCACPTGQEKRSRPSCEILKCVVPKQELHDMQMANIIRDYFSDHELGISHSKLHPAVRDAVPNDVQHTAQVKLLE
jgi:hypothetical protein